jgi:hypothetical protein
LSAFCAAISFVILKEQEAQASGAGAGTGAGPWV